MKYYWLLLVVLLSISCEKDPKEDFLLHNPDLRNEMGHAGRKRVEQHFTIEQMVKKTEALYEELLTATEAG